jgi:2'-5' RNA ligase
MRCFIAIDLNHEVREKIREIQESIRKLDVDVKFVEPENLHFTVNFLGDVDENGVNAIKKMLENVKNENEFVVKISGIGYFGSKNYLRVIWAGVKEGEDNLINLMKNVNKNVKFGEKTSTPHLTIGRVRTSRNRETLVSFIENSKNVNMGEMDVKEVKLKMSKLAMNGPIYSDLFVLKLGLK